jgi:hypothetical protein
MAFKVQGGSAQIAIHQAQTVLVTASAFFPAGRAQSRSRSSSRVPAAGPIRLGTESCHWKNNERLVGFL